MARRRRSRWSCGASKLGMARRPSGAARTTRERSRPRRPAKTPASIFSRRSPPMTTTPPPRKRWRTPHPQSARQVARRPRNVDGHAGAAGERSLWRASRHPAPRQLERDFRREHEREHDLPVSTRGQQQRCDSTAKPRARADCAPAKLDGRRRGRAWAAAPPVLQLPQRQGLVRPPPPVHSLRSAVHRRNLRAASDRAARPPLASLAAVAAAQPRLTPAAAGEWRGERGRGRGGRCGRVHVRTDRGWQSVRREHEHQHVGRSC